MEEIRKVNLNFDKGVMKMLPKSFVLRHRVIPIRLEDGTLLLAMVDPTDTPVLDEVKLITGRDIEPVQVTKEQISQAITEYYKDAPPSSESTGKILEGIIGPMSEESQEDPNIDPNEAPVINLVNRIIQVAADRKASHIHVQPERRNVTVGYRVGGELHRNMGIPNYMKNALISRLKIMAELNIAERRTCQTGIVKLRCGRDEYTSTFSFMPGKFGERCVIQLGFCKNDLSDRLARIGLDNNIKEIIIRQLESPGVVIFFGNTPIASETLLLSILTELQEKQSTGGLRDILIAGRISVGEQFLPGAHIVFPNDKFLSLTTIVKNATSFDPDILAVLGNDQGVPGLLFKMEGKTNIWATVENSAFSMLYGLVKWHGADPYLVSRQLKAIVGCKMIRKVCLECSVVQTYPGDIERLGFSLGKNPALRVANNAGCERCTAGYCGEVGIFEYIPIGAELAEILAEFNTLDKKQKQQELLQVAKPDFSWSAREKLLDGVTTLDEILRVLP